MGLRKLKTHMQNGLLKILMAGQFHHQEQDSLQETTQQP